MSRTRRGLDRFKSDENQPGVILLGASGMLGRAFAAELRARQWEYFAPPRSQLDLADEASIERAAGWREWVCTRPLVINCAAWTDVDGAETREAQATSANDLKGLVRLARTWEATVVNFSTDYVFDGAATTPYPVDAPRAPLNAYGRSKAAGEVTLESFPEEWINIRTSWLYAPWGKNFVLTMLKLLAEKPVVRVVNDQRGRPTSAQHLARTTLRLLDQGALRGPSDLSGHWHVTDGGECTWNEFAKEIGRLAGLRTPVEACTSADFPRPARRPTYSVLDLSKTESLLGPMVPWREALADVVSQIPH